MDSSLWTSLGDTLEKFCSEKVYHSDLNAKNILIDGENNFYLVDFDNSYFFYKRELFKKSIRRLERSLSKIDNYKKEIKNIVKEF